MNRRGNQRKGNTSRGREQKKHIESEKRLPGSSSPQKKLHNGAVCPKRGGTEGRKAD